MSSTDSESGSVDGNEAKKTPKGPVPSVAQGTKPDSSEKVQIAIRERLGRFAQVPASKIFEMEPGSSPDGFSTDAARASLQKFGPNIYASERPPGTITLLYNACTTPFNYILTGLGIISIATGDKPTFGCMIVMVVFASDLRYSLFFSSALYTEQTLKLQDTQILAG
jgi:magnesium-transporting ATPase (P-type)